MTVLSVIGMIIGIIGLIWLIVSIWNMATFSESKFGTTTGFVINAVVKPLNSAAGKVYLNPSDVPLVGNSDARYAPEVIYAYRVGDNNYKSTNFMYGGKNSFTAAEIRALMANVYVNSQVNVRYELKHPEKAYLHIGKPSYNNIWYSIGLLIIGALLVHFGRGKKSDDDVSLSSIEINNQPQISRAAYGYYH
jgi:hypothetical protein